jgi:hypothetical protein
MARALTLWPSSVQRPGGQPAATHLGRSLPYVGQATRGRESNRSCLPFIWLATERNAAHLISARHPECPGDLVEGQAIGEHIPLLSWRGLARPSALRTRGSRNSSATSMSARSSASTRALGRQFTDAAELVRRHRASSRLFSARPERAGRCWPSGWASAPATPGTGCSRHDPSLELRARGVAMAFVGEDADPAKVSLVVVHGVTRLRREPGLRKSVDQPRLGFLRAGELHIVGVGYRHALSVVRAPGSKGGGDAPDDQRGGTCPGTHRQRDRGRGGRG